MEGLTAQQATQLALFLAEKRHQRWRRGTSDCVTLVLEMHDRLYGTRWCEILSGTYTNLTEAKQILREVMDGQRWLKINNYEPVESPLSGDIAFLDGRIPSPYIVFEGQIYGYDNHKSSLRSMPVGKTGLDLVYYRKKQ